jgi:hypothetical protein
MPIAGNSEIDSAEFEMLIFGRSKSLKGQIIQNKDI